LQNYLTDRFFRVKVGVHLSSVHTQDNGIPQSSPLSGTFFLVAINDILNAIPYPIKPLLFVDNLSIHVQSGCARHAHRILQSVVKLIEEWLSSRGYRISSSKTEIIFEKRKSKTQLLPLLIGNHPNPEFETTKVLGLWFQSRHSWLPHIKQLKAKCLRALNILKYLAHPITGCNRKVLLPLYQALILSILDYGAPIYGLAPHPQLTLLETIQNSAILIYTGAFCTSPALSLCAESGLPPLHCRRLTLTAGLLSSIVQLPYTSIHEYLFSKTCTKPTFNRAHTYMKSTGKERPLSIFSKMSEDKPFCSE